jgi:hypothetical protein
MPNHIVSADVGNGGSNFVISKNGKSPSYPYLYYPSVRARSTARAEWGIDIPYKQYAWGEDVYMAGDDVINFAKTLPQSQRGAKRYGNDFHQFMIAVAMANAELPDGGVDLVIYCPPSVYVADKDAIRSTFLGEEVSIHVIGEKQPRHWLYENVSVLPECYAASMCFLFDSKGRVYESDFLMGNTLFVDIGVHTTDFVLLYNGQPNIEDFPKATYPNISVNRLVRNEVLKAIKGASSDFSMLTVEHIDQVIRNAYNGDADGAQFVLEYGGQHDITGLIQQQGDQLAEAVYQVVESDFAGLEGINKLVLIGGGALMVMGYLYGKYGEKVVDTRTYETTAVLHPIHFNAVGGLRAMLNKRLVE